MPRILHYRLSRMTTRVESFYTEEIVEVYDQFSSDQASPSEESRNSQCGKPRLSTEPDWNQLVLPLD